MPSPIETFNSVDVYIDGVFDGHYEHITIFFSTGNPYYYDIFGLGRTFKEYSYRQKENALYLSGELVT